MKQGGLWRNEVVKDPVVIKAWLEKCLAVLAGEHPHTGAWYWRKTNWNEYALVCGRHTHRFNDYGKLYAFCKERGVNAKQA